MDKYDELKRLIHISYGESDLIFAGHGHAFENESSQLALQEAFKLRLGFKEYIKFHKEFLVNKGVTDDHLKRQLNKVKNLDSYFEAD